MKTLLPLLENYPLPAIKTIKKWLNCILILLLATLGFQPVFGQSIQTFNGNGTFTVPAGVTSITVECWGGGGRGGTRTTSGAGGGGGGGAYSRSVIAVTPGSNHTVNVGSGSTGTAAGGDSWFATAGTVMAKGGSSVGNNSATGAAGGAAGAGVGTIRNSGGNGFNGNTSGTDYGGGGGSSAGTAANGANGTNG